MRSTITFPAICTLHWLFIFGGLSGAAVVQAEIAGIDTPLFADSFDPDTFIPIARMSGGAPSLGLVHDITGPVGGNFSLTITSPVGGSTTEPSVDVMGTLTDAPVNTGVTLNGVIGAVTDGHFLLPNVPLTTSSSNTLSVTATKLTGQTATASITLMQSGVASMSLQADHAIGFAPLTVTFNANIDALPNPVLSVAIDFGNDNHCNNYVGTSLSGVALTCTYTQAGVYTAHVTVTDANNNTYTSSRSVLIQEESAQRGMLADIYGYLKDRFNAQDAAGASLAYQSSVRDNYLNLFNALGPSMPAAVTKLGTIVNGFIGMGYADLVVVRDNDDQTYSGYPVRMTQGSDGVWRISGM